MLRKVKPWLIGLGILAVAVMMILFFISLNLVGKLVVLSLIFTILFAIWDKFGSTWIIMALAHKDVWWSPYRMLPDPGQINLMTWGLSEPGPFAMLLAGHIPELHYHTGYRRFYRERTPAFRRAFPNGPPKPQGKAAEMKVAWVGFFKRYYRRSRTWLAMDTVGGQHKIVEKKTTDKNDHIFYFSTSMALRVKQIARITEDSKAPVPAVLDLSFNALLINPEKAEFIAGKWEEKTVGAVQSRMRNYISTRTVDQLREEKDDTDKNDLVDDIIGANYKKPGTETVGLMEEFGVKIEAPFFEDFQLEEGDPEIFAAQKKVTIAALKVLEADEVIKSEEKLGIARKMRDLQEAEGIKAKVDVYSKEPVVALAMEANLGTLVWGGNVPLAVTPTPPSPKAETSSGE